MPNEAVGETKIAFGAGLVALDWIVPHGDRPHQFAAGGTCGNVLTILAHLGWSAYPVATLDESPAGQLVCNDMARRGVHLDFVSLSSDGCTPVFVQQSKLAESGYPKHLFTRRCPTCGLSFPRFKAPSARECAAAVEHVGSAAVFFFDRVSEPILALAAAARDSGSLIVFEPARLGNEAAFSRALALSHVVKYAAQSRFRLACDQGSDVSLHVETLGQRGVRYRLHGGAWRELPAFGVSTIVDAAGCGDWCSAGLLWHLGEAELLSPDDWSDEVVRLALEYGQAFAAHNCLVDGARGLMGVHSSRHLVAMVRELVQDGGPIGAFEPCDSVSWTELPICPHCGKHP